MIDCSKTENYFAEKRRMIKKYRLNDGAYICGVNCANCPLNSLNNGTSDKITCSDFEVFYPEKAIKKVQKWSNEHPQKTYLTEFLKNYPNALLKDDGTPEICLSSLGLTNYNGCRNGITCSECWNQPIEDGEE
ncbi:MAG TPA: hypothetical protein DCY01_05805 [Ruminococcus sp.]|nr:hypothetical protein [Ruminococcus sp.]HBA01737.1 hypothetical protein [Ruminococcus sp.]